MMGGGDLMFRLAELERRLANVVRAGAVAEADYPAARVRVRIGDIVTDWLPWLTARAGGDRCWWAPEVGEQVVVVAPAGELAQAWVLPGGFSAAAPAPAASADVMRAVFGDGLAVSHDRARRVTTIDARDSEGTIVLRAKNLVLQTSEGGFFHIDNHGRAERLTHLEGEQFVRETWQSGSTVITRPDHGFTPPAAIADLEDA